MKFFLTKSGKAKLINELQILKKRKEILKEEIAKARDFGDIRENAEYHAAKETLFNILNRLSILINKIRSSEIIENVDLSAVHIGVSVTIQDESTNIYKYTIVDTEEADPTI
ncbi:MAG: hypothetical protein LBM96_11680, partial [Methanobrevibacter sp.]|nr:hypothetical protein [Candidatus Methanoflexus mossambicus]